MVRLERMIKKDECSSPGEDTDAKREKQSKKKCLIHFGILQKLLEDFSKEDLTNAYFSSRFHRAFSSLFGEEVEYFAPRLFFNMDKLENQLNVEEFNEEIAMVVFKVLKNQLQQFLTMQISMDSDDQKTNHFFTEYTLCDAQMFQNILVSLMDSIEKAIAERGLYKIVHDSRVNERTMQTHEGIISKDASEIDNNVAGASHDKDNITEIQRKGSGFYEKQYIKNLEQEKEELQDQVLKIKNATKAFKQDEDKYVNNIIQLEAKNKDLENIVCKMGKSSQTLRMLTNEQSLYRETKRKMGFGYTDPCPLGKAIACHPKLYDAKVLELSPEQECFSNAPISSESESSKEMSDLPVLKMPNIAELEKTLAKQTKENSDLLIKIDNLENAFADEVKRATMGKLTVFDKENYDFGSKVTHLEKIISQKAKDFDDVKLELSNKTARFEAYFEKLENTKVILERQLAHKVVDSKAEKDQFLKEINHLRIQLENLKGKSVKTKFDKSSILGKPPADKLLITSQLSKSWSTPKIVVQKDLSKPVTAQSLPKNEKDQL
ncbi:hypothetical protein Tco_0749127 [Tanacetum coccineum]|uniref:Uncharacterized protein n=1 Tax=Tanacetum coccineum TaxID=301880 RepID=A0ABQ4YYU3_9ASTR